MHDAPDPIAADEPGWRAIVQYDWVQRFIASAAFLAPSSFALVILAEVIVRGVFTGAQRGDIGTRIGTTLGVTALVLVSSVVIHALRHPVPQANLRLGLLRVGRRTQPLVMVDVATAVLRPVKTFGSKVPTDTVALRFGVTKGLQAAVLLRSAKGPLLDEHQRAFLVAVLDQTSIRMPSSEYDPTGRFAHHNFPENLDREGAIDLVRRSGELSTDR